MPRATTRILNEIAQLRDETRSDLRHLAKRIDGVNARVDTVIDAIAALRTDFASHTHE